MQEAITRWIGAVSGVVWGAPALILILGVGLLLSVRTRFVQLRQLSRSCRSVFGRGSMRQRGAGEHGVSPFQAVCTALAATIGTGNIAGVAGAISIGGPGAVFWMWIAALLGMGIKYAEVVLAVRYRRQAPDGTYRGGPMYFIEDGMGKRFRWLGCLFCAFGIIAAFGIGNCAQISTVITAIHSAADGFGIRFRPHTDLWIGLALGAIVALVLLGGVRRIGAVAEYLVPVMSVCYVLLSIGVLARNCGRIPSALASIIWGAFSPQAVTGGAVGSMFLCLRTGVSRGVFTNEAGMGTASIAHAGADAVHPAEQGLFGIFEVFADTIVICSMTALVILCSGIPIPYGMESGAELTISAFVLTYGQWVSIFTAFAMICFAFSTVLGWGLYGLHCAEYLLGRKGIKSFAILHAFMTVAGSVLRAELLWQFSEAVNGLMAIPNLLALLCLNGEVVRQTLAYFLPASPWRIFWRIPGKARICRAKHGQ